jgi:hypothetical protein
MGTGSRRGAEALGRRIAVAVPFVVVNPSLIPSRRRGFARNLFRGVKTSREAARARRGAWGLIGSGKETQWTCDATGRKRNPLHRPLWSGGATVRRPPVHFDADDCFLPAGPW